MSGIESMINGVTVLGLDGRGVLVGSYKKRLEDSIVVVEPNMLCGMGEDHIGDLSGMLRRRELRGLDGCSL